MATTETKKTNVTKGTLKSFLKASAEVTPDKFREYVIPSLTLYYDKKELLDLAYDIYKVHYKKWEDKEQVQIICDIFNEEYAKASYYDRDDVPGYAISFCHDLDFTNEQLEDLYHGLLKLAEPYRKAETFIILAFNTTNFKDIAKREFIINFKSTDYYNNYRFLFYYHFERVEDYCDKEIFIAIANHLKTTNYNVDEYVSSMIQHNQIEALRIVLKGENITLDSSELNELKEYAQKQNLTDIYKRACHLTLDIYESKLENVLEYYNILTDSEKNKELDFLCEVARSNHFEKAFKVAVLPAEEITTLRGLTLEQFTQLSDIIKTKFKDKYPKAILQAIEKKVNKDEENKSYAIVFTCLEKYQEAAEILLSDQNVIDISFMNQNYRTTYLKLLQANNLLSITQFTHYEG